MDKKMLEFPVAIYGNLEKYNEVLTKARCRIFYKYGNRAILCTHLYSRYNIR